MLFSFPFLALRSFLVGITQTKPLNMAAFTAVLVNIPMNGLLIFGFDMGISGAAIASSFAEMCSLAVLAAYLFARIDKRRYGLCRSFDTKIYPAPETHKRYEVPSCSICKSPLVYSAFPSELGRVASPVFFE